MKKLDLKTISAIVAILSVCVTIYSTIISTRESKRADSLYTKTVVYEDELGRTVTENMQLVITNKELKEINKKDSSKLTAYERKILKLTAQSNIKKKSEDIINYEMMAFTSQKSVQMRNKFETETDSMTMIPMKHLFIEDKYLTLKLIYNPENDSININIINREEFYVEGYLERKPKKDGKQVPYILRWMKSWEFKSSIKTMSDSTVITDFTTMKLKKHRGKIPTID